MTGGTLCHLLANPIYRGQIVHKGEVYPGEHESIVSEDLWQAVQAKLKANASVTSRRLRGQQPSLLTGILKDSDGRAMTPNAVHFERLEDRMTAIIARYEAILDGRDPEDVKSLPAGAVIKGPWGRSLT